MMRGLNYNTRTFLTAGDMTAVGAGRLVSIDDDGRASQNATANGVCVGALYGGPKGSAAGQPISVAVIEAGSRVNLVAGGAVQAGEYVVSNNAGQAVKHSGANAKSLADAPANTYVVGRAVEAAASSGDRFQVECVDQWVSAA